MKRGRRGRILAPDTELTQTRRGTRIATYYPNLRVVLTPGVFLSTPAMLCQAGLSTLLPLCGIAACQYHHKQALSQPVVQFRQVCNYPAVSFLLTLAIDNNLQVSGNPAGAGLTTGTHGRYIVPPGQTRDRCFQVAGNPLDAVRYHTRDRPTSRLPPTSGPPSIVGFGAIFRGPHQQQPESDNPTSHAPPRHLSPYRAGSTNPSRSPNALLTTAPRQPSDDFGAPLFPRRREDAGRSVVRPRFTRPAPFLANHVQVNPHPGAPTDMEAYGGPQIQRTNQVEQSRRRGNNPNAALAYIHPTLNPSSPYRQSSAHRQPSIYDHPSAYGEASIHGQASAYGQAPVYGRAPAYRLPPGHGSPFSSAYGSSAAYAPSAPYVPSAPYDSFDVNHFALPYGSASVPPPSEHDPSNDDATSADLSISAYDSLQSRRDHGLPPHLVGPEPLVPRGPLHQQIPHRPSLPTNASSNNGPRRGQGPFQPAATSAGTHGTRVTQSTYKLVDRCTHSIDDIRH